MGTFRKKDESMWIWYEASTRGGGGRGRAVEASWAASESISIPRKVRQVVGPSAARGIPSRWHSASSLCKYSRQWDVPGGPRRIKSSK